ncbi:MAG: response regulator transcription factor [Ignavibacteriaceae bacterium]
MKLRIIIADDHSVVRSGLNQILSEQPDLQVIAEFSNGSDIIDFLKNSKADLLIMDLSMPNKGGLEVLSELRQLDIEIPVLILSMHSEESYGLRVLKAGAAGYLTKESAPDELLTAVRKILSGGKYISENLRDKLLEELEGGKIFKPHENLSDREYQVMILIAGGKTVSEIADKLNLSTPTISTYRSRILEKLNLKNNAEITYYALKNRLLD